MSKRAPICDISDQDEAYLAKRLLEQGYHVTSTSRDRRKVLRMIVRGEVADPPPDTERGDRQ